MKKTWPNLPSSRRDWTFIWNRCSQLAAATDVMTQTQVRIAANIAIVALLHDLCKIDFYKVSTRNVKNDQGVWEKVPYYTIDDAMPYGHGEKSVYIISGFLYGEGRLTREEAFAIRYHMGFSGTEDKNTIGRALEKYPLAMALNVADMEASYFIEGSDS